MKRLRYFSHHVGDGKKQLYVLGINQGPLYAIAHDVFAECASRLPLDP